MFKNTLRRQPIKVAKTSIKSDEKIYVGLCAIFSLMMVLGNLMSMKFVTISLLGFPSFEASVGTLLYPLTFFITDLVAEFYGKDRAKFCVRCAVGMSILSALLITGMDHLPATDWSVLDNRAFHQAFGAFGTLFIGSMLACYVAQTLDIPLYLFLKKLTHEKHLWLRNNGSSCISLLVDTGVFYTFLLIFDLLPQGHWWQMIQTSYLWKLSFTIANTPFFYLATRGIRRLLTLTPLTVGLR